MPVTLTVTYAVIVHCMIETRTVFNPARSLIHYCFAHVIHRSFRAQVAPASHRSVRSWSLRPLYGTTAPPGLTDLGETTHVHILGFGYSFLLAPGQAEAHPWFPALAGLSDLRRQLLTRLNSDYAGSGWEFRLLDQVQQKRPCRKVFYKKF